MNTQTTTAGEPVPRHLRTVADHATPAWGRDALSFANVEAVRDS